MVLDKGLKPLVNKRAHLKVRPYERHPHGPEYAGRSEVACVTLRVFRRMVTSDGII